MVTGTAFEIDPARKRVAIPVHDIEIRGEKRWI